MIAKLERAINTILQMDQTQISHPMGTTINNDSTTLFYSVVFSFVIILLSKRELAALLNSDVAVSALCYFLTKPRVVCLFVRFDSFFLSLYTA